MSKSTMKRARFLQAVAVDCLLFGMGLVLHFVYGPKCKGADGVVIGFAVLIAAWLFAWVVEEK